MTVGTDRAIELMRGYAERSGVRGGAQRRYLWTDAFAVCNLLGLSAATHDAALAETAAALIDAVHATLGSHRADGDRRGPLSALPDVQAAAHPTRAGLRIGKALPERSLEQPLDPDLEWQRDGQYFHYLTKWMHALDQAARATGRCELNVWARELAIAAFDAFTYRLSANGPLRIYWKMSIDLTRPLVTSTGQHDALDGYVTFIELEATARTAPARFQEWHVGGKADELASAIGLGDLGTLDPLGLGGLLFDAARLEQLHRRGAVRDESVVALLLAAATDGVAQYVDSGELRLPAGRRLAFRELGLAIGLHALELIAGDFVSADLERRVAALHRYAPVAAEIESFWLQPAAQRSALWLEHRDINEVMLATALAPAGFTELRYEPLANGASGAAAAPSR